MTDAIRCSSCGLPIDPPGPSGLCPACLLKMGLAEAGSATISEGLDGRTRLSGAPVEGEGLDHDATRLDSGAGARRTPVPALREMPGYIGPYKILKTLGEGGMGVVYLAEQERPLRRLVAIKVIKTGMDTRDVVARFDAERQALALMDHPHIAHVYDAGSTADGRPYFVMEHVVGAPMTEFCDARRLSTPARLQLFIDVCGAIQHAHQKGVIHRDLKPSNVLVAEQDGRFVPKVIDFGIAKAVEQSGSDRTLLTEQGMMVGTPEYMSPEQAALSADIDTTTDVYSLGVLLYELLVGALPFDSKMLRAAGYDEMRRVIRESDPPKPSTRFTALGGKATTVAGTRQTDVGPLTRQLKGDLDWITLKALEKDRTRRYTTAAAFAQDIARYLANEPVDARPPSATYLMRKFTRKYRGAVSAAAALLIVLLAGLTVSTLQYFRAERERVKAETLRNEADQQRRQAEAAGAAEKAARSREAEQRLVAEAQTQVAQQAQLAAETNLYFNNIDLADRELLAGNIGHVDQLLGLCPPGLRSWEWHRLSRLSHMETNAVAVSGEAVQALTFTADGTRLVAVTNDMRLTTWDAKTRQQTRSIAFGDPQAYLKSPVRLSSLRVSANGTAIAGGIITAAFARFIDNITVWDVATGRPRFVKNETRMPGGGLAFIAFALSPSGGQLITASADLAGGKESAFYLQRWDGQTGSALGSKIDAGARVNLLEFSADGSRIAASFGPLYGNQEMKLLDGTSGSVIASLSHAAPLGTVSALAFSPDRTLVAAGLGTVTNQIADSVPSVKVWSISDGKELWSARLDSAVTRVIFSPNGQSIVAALADHTLRILDRETGKEVGRLSGHSGEINTLTFTPDGSRLVSAGLDKTARFWDVSGVVSKPTALEPVQSGRPMNLRLSSDHRLVLAMTATPPKSGASSGRPGPGSLFSSATLESWDAITGRHLFGAPLSAFAEGWFMTTSALIASERNRVAIPDMVYLDAGGSRVASRYAIRIADTVSGKDVTTLRQQGITGTLMAGPPAMPPGRFDSAVPNDLAFDSAASLVAVVTTRVSLSNAAAEPRVTGDQVDVWNIAASKLAGSILLPTMHVRKAVLSSEFGIVALVTQTQPDETPGQRAVMITELGLYDVASGRRQRALSGFEYTGVRPVFSKQNGCLAGTTANNSLTVWDVRTGQTRFILPGTKSAIASMSFSSDGSRFVSVTRDGVVTLWNARTGALILPLRDASSVRTVTLAGSGSAETPMTIDFGEDGTQIVLTTIGPASAGLARIEIKTWNGAPR